MEIVNAASATAVVGSSVSPLPRVRVKDVDGNPVAGVTVNFSAAGGGSLAAPTAVTDGEGIATAPAWTLGTTVAVNTLTASVEGLTGSPKMFAISTTAGPPAVMSITGGDGQTATAGTFVPVAPIVRVTDSFGNPIPNVSVIWSVTAGNGTISPAQGSTGAGGFASALSWRLGPVPATNTVRASLADNSLSATFTATGQYGPAAIAVVAGLPQVEMAGNQVRTAPSVRVIDGTGAPVGGATVTFAVSTGGGSITGASVTTGSDGIATMGSWTLGATPALNTVTATVAGSGVANNPIVFSASGCGGAGADYKLTLCFTSEMTPGQRSAFTIAAARWEGLITGDLADEVVSPAIGAGACGATSFGIPRDFVIDDLLIFAAVVPIDGVGQVLGSAGPCFLRDVGLLSVIGTMRFDAADVANLESSGRLNSVILHEMGHVLGIGTLWDNFGFLINRTNPGGTQNDTHFNGPNAIEAFNTIGGATYTGGAKVPVENNPSFGAGTVNGHWREATLQNELMTGFINSNGSNPLSVLTVRSLQDLGYTVNVGGADPFFLALSVSEFPSAPRLQLVDDLYAGPLYRRDSLGRIVRIR